MDKSLLITLAVLVAQAFMPINATSKVHIFKQWHLLASKNTLNIEESLALPQSKNQIDLYEKLKSFINTKPQALMLFEGCEGKIDESFSQTFQGWNYENLQNKLKNKSEYKNILTHLGLKLEVEFKDRADNQCGDNLKDIKAHQLAFSDFKAFLGYSQRLEQYRENPEKFELYTKTMVQDNLQVTDPFMFAVQSAKNAFLRVKLYLRQRNNSFIEKVLKDPKRDVSIVIGGLHIDDMTEQLKSHGIRYKVYTPKGYPSKDEELLKEFEKVLFKK